MGNCNCCGENRELYRAMYQGKDANVCRDCLKITDKEWDALGKRVIDAQKMLITKRYGKRAAKEARYGYGQSEFREDSVDLATKIYLPEGSVILVTTIKKSAIVRHEWQHSSPPGCIPTTL